MEWCHHPDPDPDQDRDWDLLRSRVAAVMSVLCCSHRRPYRHQEYKRIVIIVIVFQFFMLFGLLSYSNNTIHMFH